MFGKKKPAEVTATDTPVINIGDMMKKPEDKPEEPKPEKNLDIIIKDVASRKGFIDETGKYWVKVDDVLEALFKQ